MNRRAYRRAVGLLAGLWLAVVGPPASAAQPVSAPTLYTGMSDASAGCALGTNHFIVCDDESNELRVYRRDAGGAPLQTYSVAGFLNIDPRHPETDLECAARIGDVIYWMSSQGRNRNAKDRWNRHYFFALKVEEGPRGFVFSPVGRPYHELIADLVTAPQLRRFNLAAAASRAPKDPQGLNIEGLAATPDRELLIGIRNPIPGGKALVVPLKNPQGVMQGEKARLGAPLLLDLDGLGVRDFALADGRWLIIGGPSGEGGPFKLFKWKGPGTEPNLIKHVKLKDFHAEAIIFYPDKGWREFQILSDDGSRPNHGIANKTLPFSQRQFRAVWVTP